MRSGLGIIASHYHQLPGVSIVSSDPIPPSEWKWRAQTSVTAITAPLKVSQTFLSVGGTASPHFPFLPFSLFFVPFSLSLFFVDAANNHHFKRARWRRLWRQQIQDYLIAAIQNLRILLTHQNPKPSAAAAAALPASITRLQPGFAY